MNDIVKSLANRAVDEVEEKRNSNLYMNDIVKSLANRAVDELNKRKNLKKHNNAHAVPKSEKNKINDNSKQLVKKVINKNKQPIKKVVDKNKQPIEKSKVEEKLKESEELPETTGCDEVSGSGLSRACGGTNAHGGKIFKAEMISVINRAHPEIKKGFLHSMKKQELAELYERVVNDEPIFGGRKKNDRESKKYNPPNVYGLPFRPPGHKYSGPGNEFAESDNPKPYSYLDAVSLLHDVEYEIVDRLLPEDDKYRRRGVRIADMRHQENSRKSEGFIDSAESFLTRQAFNVKQGLENIGVPVYPKYRGGCGDYNIRGGCGDSNIQGGGFSPDDVLNLADEFVEEINSNRENYSKAQILKEISRFFCKITPDLIDI